MGLEKRCAILVDLTITLREQTVTLVQLTARNVRTTILTAQNVLQDQYFTEINVLKHVRSTHTSTQLKSNAKTVLQNAKIVRVLLIHVLPAGINYYTNSTTTRRNVHLDASKGPT